MPRPIIWFVTLIFLFAMKLNAAETMTSPLELRKCSVEEVSTFKVDQTPLDPQTDAPIDREEVRDQKAFESFGFRFGRFYSQVGAGQTADGLKANSNRPFSFNLPSKHFPLKVLCAVKKLRGTKDRYKALYLKTLTGANPTGF